MAQTHTQITLEHGPAPGKHTVVFDWQAAVELVPLRPVKALQIVVPVAVVGKRRGVVPYEPGNALHRCLPKYITRVEVLAEDVLAPGQNAARAGSVMGYTTLDLLGMPATHEPFTPLCVQPDGTVAPEKAAGEKNVARRIVGAVLPSFEEVNATVGWMIDLRLLTH